MSGKASRISELWNGVDPRGRDVRYAAFFHHFNRTDYYEAHDVLESLWLEGGRQAESGAFYQGLIQLAGALVHLRKNFENPEHRVHRERLKPAYRLFDLALRNLGRYGEEWEGIALRPVREMAEGMKASLSREGWQKNPWRPEKGPQLVLPSVLA